MDNPHNIQAIIQADCSAHVLGEEPETRIASVGPHASPEDKKVGRLKKPVSEEPTFRGTGVQSQRCARFFDISSLSTIGTHMNAPSDEWIRTLEDGRKVKFTYQELLEDGAFITAQLAGN
jgi:hypothetical protein